MNEYLQSFGVDWRQVCGGGELGRAGTYLYYVWSSGRIVNVGVRKAILSVMDDDGRPIRNSF